MRAAGRQGPGRSGSDREGQARRPGHHDSSVMGAGVRWKCTDANLDRKREGSEAQRDTSAPRRGGCPRQTKGSDSGGKERGERW